MSMINRCVVLFFILFFSSNASAAISFITSNSERGNDSRGSLNMPLSVAGDDLLLAQVVIRNRNGSNGVTAPIGWTQIGVQVADGEVLQSLYYRVATASDAGSNQEWTWSGNRRFILGVSVYRGVDTATPVDDYSSGAGVSWSRSWFRYYGSVTAPSISSTSPNAMLVGFYSLAESKQSFTPGSGMSEIYDVSGNGNNSLTATAAFDTQGAAGSSGNKIADIDGSQNNSGRFYDAIGQLVALNESTELPPVSSTWGSCGTDNLIVVQYTSAAGNEALDASNYALSSGSITGITRQDSNTVVLAIGGLVGGQAYTLTIQGTDHTVSFDGLMGHYYDQRNNSGTKQSRNYFAGNLFLSLDPQVNFNWGTGAPAAFLNTTGNENDFSIRWKGYIVPTQAGNYRFRTNSDDGVRLYLEPDGAIISNWTDHSPTVNTSGTKSLSSGDSYEVTMEFYERTGGAVAELEWQRNGGSWESIPTANLTTCPLPAVPSSAFEFRMDELSWDGTPGEVIEESGNNATARGGLTTVDPGYLCRGGGFDGVDDYIEAGVIGNTLTGTSSLSFWIKTTQTGSNTGWRAPGVTGIEQAGGSDDIFWGWLDASGRIGLSVGDDYTSKSKLRINDGVYHHIVLTRDAAAGAYKIYIDGALNKSGALAGGIIGNSFSSIGRIEDTGGTPEYFRGDLDEVKVFGGVLTDENVMALYNETRECSCTLGSFAITQPTYALACPNARAPINIKAMCDDGVTVKDDYAGTIDLSTNQNTQSEFYLASSGGSNITDITLTGSENGEVDVYLFHKNEYPTLKVTAADAVESISSEAATGTDVRTSGFRVDQSPNFNFVCGNTQSFTITAVGQNSAGGNSCNTITGFTGSKAIKAWADVNIDPSTPGVKSTGLPKRILLDGSAVAENKPSSSNMNIDFNAGVATVEVAYEDVGEVMRVNFEHDDPPYDGSVAAITNSLTGSLARFIVRPDKIDVQADSADAACASNFANCSKFVRANEPFAMTTKALCVGTPELIAQSYRGVVSLTSDLKAPSGGTLAAPAVNEVIFDGAPSAGVETMSNQQIAEVGVFTITATPPAYFGTTIPVSESDHIGRFYPASFDVSINPADFSLSCNSSFTYMSQPFSYLTAPEVTIQALSYTGDVTENYEGDFWKLGSSLDKAASCTGPNFGYCYTDNVAGGALFSSPDANQNYGTTADVNGSVTMTMHALVSDEFIYQRPISGALVSPFDADVALTIRLRDDDGVLGNGELANIGFSGDPDGAAPGSPMNTTNNKYLRYGRWGLENAFGPETNSLKIAMSAEYYDGGNFITNTDDSCSTFDSVDMQVAPNLKSSGTTSATGSGSANAGVAERSNQIELSAPGVGHEGIAELCLDVERWLKFDWNNNGLDESQVCDASAAPTMGDNDNPMSTATFGRYRGHDRVIYWRELSN